MAGDISDDVRSLTASSPTFGTVEEERQHRLERLAGVCRVFGRLGYSEGLLGHITVRDPEHADRFWINPVGVSFRQMRVSHLVQVAHDGTVIGKGMINPVGFRLHAAVHSARPEVNAVCHAHSLYGKAWSSLGRCLDPITQDSAVFFEQQALIATRPRVALTVEQGNEFAAQFGDKRVAIQIGHGLFTTGRSVDEAAWWFITMETSCQAQLLAEAAGTPELWESDEARMMVGALGTPEFGWASFQPLWNEVSESDPDLRR